MQTSRQLIGFGLRGLFSLAMLEPKSMRTDSGCCALSGDTALRNVMIFYRPGRFGGWPANHGLWAWGDEILVGFSAGRHKDLGPERHNMGTPGIAARTDYIVEGSHACLAFLTAAKSNGQEGSF